MAPPSPLVLSTLRRCTRAPRNAALHCTHTNRCATAPPASDSARDTSRMSPAKRAAPHFYSARGDDCSALGADVIAGDVLEVREADAHRGLRRTPLLGDTGPGAPALRRADNTRHQVLHQSTNHDPARRPTAASRWLRRPTGAPNRINSLANQEATADPRAL